MLHAAAWTKVDEAERIAPRRGASISPRRRNVVALGALVVYYSTDYVFDGTKAERYIKAIGPVR